MLKNKMLSIYVLFVAFMMVSPAAVSASTSWLDNVTAYAKNIQIGLYALAGTIVLCCVVVSGIRLAFSRMSGSHDKSFFDYITDLSMALWIGAGIVIATALWQVMGTSS